MFKSAADSFRPRRSFHCRSRLPCEQYRAAGALVVLVAVQLSVPGLYLPPVFKTVPFVVHPRRSFRCRSTLPCDSIGQRAHWWCWWLSNCRCWDYIFRRCSKSPEPSVRPRRSFHCRSTLPCASSGSGRVGGAGGRPTVGDGIISAAGVQIEWCQSTAPDDHFTAGPDCRVNFGHRAHWWCWWLSNCRCWDCISRRCSKHAVISAPDDHFTASPDCRVMGSGIGGIGECRWSPRIIGAATRGTSYYRKRVGSTPRFVARK